MKYILYIHKYVGVLQAQQMTMQAIAIQQQMLSSFPPVAPAPQSPPSQHHHAHLPHGSDTASPVSKHTGVWRSMNMHMGTLASMYTNSKYCLKIIQKNPIYISCMTFSFSAEQRE